MKIDIDNLQLIFQFYSLYTIHYYEIPQYCSDGSLLGGIYTPQIHHPPKKIKNKNKNKKNE